MARKIGTRLREHHGGDSIIDSKGASFRFSEMKLSNDILQKATQISKLPPSALGAINAQTQLSKRFAEPMLAQQKAWMKAVAPWAKQKAAFAKSVTPWATQAAEFAKRMPNWADQKVCKPHLAAMEQLGLMNHYNMAYFDEQKRLANAMPKLSAQLIHPIPSYMKRSIADYAAYNSQLGAFAFRSIHDPTLVVGLKAPTSIVLEGTLSRPIDLPAPTWNEQDEQSNHHAKSNTLKRRKYNLVRQRQYQVDNRPDSKDTTSADSGDIGVSDNKSVQSPITHSLPPLATMIAYMTAIIMVMQVFNLSDGYIQSAAIAMLMYLGANYFDK